MFVFFCKGRVSFGDEFRKFLIILMGNISRRWMIFNGNIFLYSGILSRIIRVEEIGVIFCYVIFFEIELKICF